MTRAPQRVVCLSAESADWLWRIGAWDNVVGVTSCFTPAADVPPKPPVSSFSTARFDEIVALKPDLVITFSDVQAALAAELIKRGLTVFATNQRTIAEIEATLALLGRVVGREAEAEQRLREFRERLAPVESCVRPRVYFEEWNDPFISGIAWISELIQRAGGEDIFADLQECRAASQRVVTSEQVVRQTRRSSLRHGVANRCARTKLQRGAGTESRRSAQIGSTKFPGMTFCNQAFGWCMGTRS